MIVLGISCSSDAIGPRWSVGFIMGFIRDPQMGEAAVEGRTSFCMYTIRMGQ